MVPARDDCVDGARVVACRFSAVRCFPLQVLDGRHALGRADAVNKRERTPMLKTLWSLCAAALLATAVSCADVDSGATQSSSSATAASSSTAVPCTEIENSGGVCKGATPRKFRCPRVNAARPANCGSTHELNPGDYKTLCCP
jgi:hypothetical protein